MSNNIFIDLTEELANKGWTVHWEFNSDIDPALLKYNNCVTYLDCYEINPDVATDVDGNGAWNYRLDNLETGGVIDEEAMTFDGLFAMKTTAYNNSLVSFNADLPNLTDGTFMFMGCKNLTSFEVDLSTMTNGTLMFTACLYLASFEGKLTNLQIGQSMFFQCLSLTSFSSALPNLIDGIYMFGDSTSTCTRLDLASVQNIAETINDLTGKTPDDVYGWGQISIGISSSIQGNADLETALATIRAKGWTVTEIYGN